MAVFLESCGGDDAHGLMDVIDVEGRKLLAVSRPDMGAQSLSISPDAKLVVAQQEIYPNFGPLVVRDLRTGKAVVKLEGLCTYDGYSGVSPGQDSGCKTYPEQPFPIWAYTIQWSPDGTLIAAIDGSGTGFVAVWDALSGRLLRALPHDPGLEAQSLIFTPDSKGLVVSFGDGEIKLVSTETWTVLRQTSLDSLQGGDSLRFVGYTPGASSLLAIGGFLGGEGGAIHWLDPQTLSSNRPSMNDVFEGTPRSAALNPDGSLMATGTSAGDVQVWDTRDGSLIHEIQTGHVPVAGVAFVDDKHLAVTPRTGNLLFMTIDTDELLKLVRIR